MTAVGSPDWLDSRQPQINADLLLTTGIAIGASSVGPLNIGQQQGIYTYYQVACVSYDTLNIAVSVFDPVSGGGSVYQRWTANNSTAVFYLPTTGFMGDDISVQVNLSSNVVTQNMVIYVYGLRVWPSGLRFDGLYPPQATSRANANQGDAGTTPFGLNPSPPSRLLVGTIDFRSTAVGGTAYARVTATIQGLPGPLVSSYGGPGAEFSQFPQGLLLDPGAQLSIVQTGAGFSSAEVTYDVVV